MEAVVNNHLEVARYMVQLGGCVYSKVRDGAGELGGGRKKGYLGTGC
jgi:euchromatic histone-lysine N-methyltransferase